MSNAREIANMENAISPTFTELEFLERLLSPLLPFNVSTPAALSLVLATAPSLSWPGDLERISCPLNEI